MFTTKSKHKRAATSSPSQVPSLQLTSKNGLFECYNFLAPNEYSERTFGTLACLLRNSVGDINFSHLIDEAEKRAQQGQDINIGMLLEEKRMSLQSNEASIEKCLMLTRWISYIQDNEAEFISTLSDIRLDMKLKMTDTSNGQSIVYPQDFRRREQDFSHRRNAQEIRRLFYLSHKEAKEPPSIIHLQNRVTEHLRYLVDGRMRYESKFQDTGIKEMESIFNNSFMIIRQPHWGVNPVVVCERKEPGEHTAKISLTVVSLLHDFMETHPNFIELFDIELSLWPLSPSYKLDDSQILSWKTCQIQASPTDRPRTIQYAELSFITIVQSKKGHIRLPFTESLHSLKLAIKIHVNLTEYKFSRTYQIPLETALFAMVTNTNQVPHMLTRVMLDDIRRFAKTSSVDINMILSFVMRYFKHRTGVIPHGYLRNYVETELQRAQDNRRNFQTLEDIFMGFLVPFVHHVEFMAKNPILSMFYADDLFLGTCNSDRAADMMMSSSGDNSSVVGLRMNSIRIEYNSLSTSSFSNGPIKVYPCSVRVDIYNKNRKKFQYRTLDTAMLPHDIMKFVSTAHTDKASGIRILLNIDKNLDAQNYKSFSDFTPYYHDRLHAIYRTNEKYRPVTNLMLNVDEEDGDDDGSHHSNNNQRTELADIFADNPYSVPPLRTPASNHEHALNTDRTQNCNPMPYAESGSTEPSLQNVRLSTLQQSSQPSNNEDLVRLVLSQPDFLAQLLREVNIQQPSQTLYQNQPVFQTQLQYQQQQEQLSTLNYNQQNNGNQYAPDHGNQWIPQQNSTHVQLLPMSEDRFIGSNRAPLEFITTDQLTSEATSDLLQFDESFLFE